jgi:hypothetical protein
MFINGVFFEIINVLILLMQSMGPTPVAGLGGTTAAFLANNHGAQAAHSAASRLK